MQPPQINDTIQLEIHGLGSNGEGVGYYHGFTIFVEGALPNETIQAKIYQRQKRFGRAHLVNIVKASPNRVKPVCPLFGTCGGCQLMHLSYSAQLTMKQQRVVDALTRIGKLEGINVAECLSSPSEIGYRNKIQLPVRQEEQGIVLGLFQRSSHDLVEVEHCYIHSPLGESIYKEVRTIIKDSGITAYDPATGTGELRHVIIKSSSNTNEALVILVTNGEQSEFLQIIAKQILQVCPNVKGVVHNINRENDNVILGRNFHVLQGQGFIKEIICDTVFKVSPASFFQVNPAQAECLYSKALEFAQLKGDETVLDAYCGVGTLSLLFSKHAKKVIGIECVSEAIDDAKENASLNGIENTEFICAQSEEYIGKIKECDVALLNPPRKGCEQSFLEGLVKLSPKKIIYVSCDPATLARDLAYLHQNGYAVEAVQPFDMFPQTAHVECVANLTKM